MTKYCEPRLADFWFPVAPGVTELPESEIPTVNEEPKPPNAVDAPEDFDEEDPNLCELFEDILPRDVDPVYPVVVDPVVSIPPYSETVLYDLRIRSHIELEAFNYALTSVTDLPLIVRVPADEIRSYPPEVEIAVKLGVEVEFEFFDFQEAIIPVSLKVFGENIKIIEPKVMAHFNGPPGSSTIINSVDGAILESSGVRLSTRQSKFNGTSGNFFAPFARVKLQTPGIAWTDVGPAWSASGWFYVDPAAPQSIQCLYSFDGASSSRNGVYVQTFANSNAYTVYIFFNDSSLNSTSVQLGTNNFTSRGAWRHFALEKPANSNELRVFTDGFYRIGRFINSTNSAYFSAVHYIGGDSNLGLSYAMFGFMADVRVAPGVNVYEGYDNYVVPTEPSLPPSYDFTGALVARATPAVEFVNLTLEFTVTVTTRLAALAPADVMATVIPYTGNGVSGRTVSTGNVKPGIAWFRRRDSSIEPVYYDSLRGANLGSYWQYNTGDITSTNVVTVFGNDSITVGNSSLTNTNGLLYYVAVFGNLNAPYVDSSSRYPVTIATNRDWGVSILRYSGDGTNNAFFDVPHGLPFAPAFIIFKVQNFGTVELFGTAIGSNRYLSNFSSNISVASGFTGISYNDTNIVIAGGNPGSNNWWNASSAITVHCWTSVPGRTKVSTYDGFSEFNQYIETGFRPAHIIIRIIDGLTTGGAGLPRYHSLEVNNDFNAFRSGVSDAPSVEILWGPNGFTVLANTDANITGARYIYLAIRNANIEAIATGETGQFSIAGTATFVRDIIMPVSAGAFALAGQEADVFSYSYRLEGETGEFDLEGQVAEGDPDFIEALGVTYAYEGYDAEFVSGDIYYNNTSLLLHMDGSDNSTTFTNSGASSLSLSVFGDAKIRTNQSKFGGASAFFDGTGDYLNVASNAALALGTQNFTIEFWVYLNAQGNYNLYDQRSTASQIVPTIYTVSGQVRYFVSNADRIIGATLTAETWNHVAISRANSVTRMFVNGTQSGSNYTDTNNYIQNPVGIGAYLVTPAGFLNGYIDELRVTQGVARYTTNFTVADRQFFDVATPAEDPDFSSVSLLMHMDGANGSTVFTDSSDSPLFFTTSGNAQISTAQSRFGNASGLFDGNGDFLTRAFDTKFDLVLSDFTIEAWVRATSLKTSMRLVATGGGTVGWNSTGGIHVLTQFDSLGRINLQCSNNTTTPISVTSTATIATNTWSHVAISVSGSMAYLSVDGAVSSHSLATRSRPSTNPQTAIATVPGEAGGSTTAFVGNIDELRITKGVARYTANFTPPVGPFPSS